MAASLPQDVSDNEEEMERLEHQQVRYFYQTSPCPYCTPPHAHTAPLGLETEGGPPLYSWTSLQSANRDAV